VWNGLDTPSPDCLVEFRIQSDVGCAHCFSCKFDDGFDSPGGTLFERSTVDTLMEVDGVFAGDDVLEGRASLASLGEVLSERKTNERQRQTFFFVVLMTCR